MFEDQLTATSDGPEVETIMDLWAQLWDWFLFPVLV